MCYNNDGDKTALRWRASATECRAPAAWSPAGSSLHRSEKSVSDHQHQHQHQYQHQHQHQPALPTHLPWELLILHAQSLLLAVLSHHHRLKVRISIFFSWFLSFLVLFTWSLLFSSCSAYSESARAPSCSFRSSTCKINQFEYEYEWACETNQWVCVNKQNKHLGAEFLHGHLGVVKHLQLLLKTHLKSSTF